MSRAVWKLALGHLSSGTKHGLRKNRSGARGLRGEGPKCPLDPMTAHDALTAPSPSSSIPSQGAKGGRGMGRNRQPDREAKTDGGRC